jgi:outer membrane protein OmpA-like peptidoglycan-associated protein
MKSVSFGNRHIFLLFLVFFLANGLFAQSRTVNWDFSYWSLNGGLSMDGAFVDGAAFGLTIDPKIQLTSQVMLGSKNGINFSTDGVISLETQLFLRWNFLSFNLNRNESADRKLDIFIQGGAGFLGALKGPYKHFDIRDSRSSLLFDVTAGVTIPITSRWHIEPSIRGGYPFIAGFAVTAGYRFPITRGKTEYVEVVKMPPANEIIRRVIITQVEYIIFAGDSSTYNERIDVDARTLNELVINQVAQLLTENRDLRVRIEGHANPVTGTREEERILSELSARRANEVAGILREMDVRDEQIIVVALGAARAIETDRDHWNVNRRVELIVIHVDID